MIDFKNDTIKLAIDYMEQRGMENAERETMWLYEHVFGKGNNLEIKTDADKEELNAAARIASLKNSKRFNDLIIRRAGGEPLQYLLGEWEFYGYPMKVGEGVLIPRPETEFLIDLGKAYVKKLTNPVFADSKKKLHEIANEIKLESVFASLNENEKIENVYNFTPVSPSEIMVIDLCAGSGCVGIAMVKETGCQALEIELSDKAHEYAKENIKLNDTENRMKLYCGDIFDADLINSIPQADCIFANPPYLSEKDMEELQREVGHEPKAALYGGKDGLDYYRGIFKSWRGKLKQGGLFAVEVGYGQAEEVKLLMRQAGFEPETMLDYSLVERIVYAIKN